MREIKFRAFFNGKMYKPTIKEKYSNVIFSGMIQVAISKKEMANTSIMQYTGLKDKNGKEIYEGDILEDVRGNYHKVIFENGSFKVVWPHINYTLGSVKSKLEIIGNIHENPELL